MTSNSSGGSNGNDRRRGLTQIGARMNDPIIDSLKQYWEKLRAGRSAPYRSEIDPRQFEHALENVFILEVIGAQDIRVRLAGMRLCDMMGMEVRGMAPSAFMMPEDRNRLDTAILDVINNTTVVEFTLEAIDFNGKIETAYLLLMPLRSDFGEITRILGCISDTQNSYEAPVRFRITQQKNDRIEYTPTSEQRPQLGFAEPRTHYQKEIERPTLKAINGGGTVEDRGGSGERERNHLRLVHTSD